MDLNSRMKPRTFTSSEVARLAGVNKETLRVWRRRDYFSMTASDGWTRFTWEDLLSIAVFAEVVNSTGSHDHARDVSKLARDETAALLLSQDDDVPLPYILAANHHESGELLEVISGTHKLVERLSDAILSDRHFGQYSVIDLGSILHRLLSRLTDETPSAEQLAEVKSVLKIDSTQAGEA